MEKSVIKFSAEGMRRLTDQSQRSLENKEFENAKDKIITAAQQGHYSLILTLEYPATIKSLQALGFKVHYATNIPITAYASGKILNYYEVSWVDNSYAEKS